MGIITNMFAYMPVFFLIELFKRTSNRKSKSKKLQNVLKSLSETNIVNLENENEKNFSKKTKLIPFPWWFKFVLFFISYILIALSICFVIFKGSYTKDIFNSLNV